MPLRVSQHSKGEGIAPPECWTFLICWNGPSSLLATTTPPITSEWPPRYLVVACTTRSAPSSRGRCRTGVAQVLSQASRAPASRAIPEISRTSVIFRRGFEGVSTQNDLVVAGGERLQDRHRGGHPRGESRRGGPSFELLHALLQGVPVGVGLSGVLVASRVAPIGVALEGRREVYRRGHRPSRRVHAAPGVYRLGLHLQRKTSVLLGRVPNRAMSRAVAERMPPDAPDHRAPSGTAQDPICTRMLVPIPKSKPGHVADTRKPR